MVTSSRPYPVKNTLDLNLTCLTVYTLGYGDREGREFSNAKGDIAAIKIYFQDEEMSSRRNLARTTSWTFRWWEIVPMKILAEEVGIHSEDYRMEIPKGLEDAFLRGAFLGQKIKKPVPQTASQAPCAKHRWIGPWNVLQIWALAAAIVSAVVALAYMSAWAIQALRGVAFERSMTCSGTMRKGALNLDDYVFLNDETGEYVQKVGIVVD